MRILATHLLVVARAHALRAAPASVAPPLCARPISRAPPPVCAAAGELRSRDQLKEGIAGFYDESSGVWEKVWGEHMHHGYYADDARKDHRQAQVDMIDETLAWAGVDAAAPPRMVLDVGCGIGGSSRHIARKFGGGGVGITLSPVQAERATRLSQDQGLGGRLNFKVADALSMPFEDDTVRARAVASARPRPNPSDPSTRAATGPPARCLTLPPTPRRSSTWSGRWSRVSTCLTSASSSLSSRASASRAAA